MEYEWIDETNHLENIQVKVKKVKIVVKMAHVNKNHKRESKL